jgi:plastocyanin
MIWRRAVWSVALAGTLALSAAACDSDSPTDPSDDVASCATITIANNAVSPNAVTVSPGCRVTFANNDSRNHDMSSDPHPEHSDCPAIDSTGVLRPGESRQTGNLNTVRTCGFHDHEQDQVQSLKGTITVR